MYAITMKRTGPKIEPEVPSKTGAGYFSCGHHEDLFEAIDAKPHLSTSTKRLQILHGWKAVSWTMHVLAKTSISFERRNQLVLENWYSTPRLEEEFQRMLQEMKKRLRRLPFKSATEKFVALNKLPNSFEDFIELERGRHRRNTKSTLSYCTDYREGYSQSPGLIRTVKREVNASPRLACTSALCSTEDLSVLTLTVLPQVAMNNHIALLTFPARLGVKHDFNELERLFKPSDTSETEFQVALSDLIIKTQNFSFSPTIYEEYDQYVKDRLQSSLWLNSNQNLLTKAFNERAGIPEHNVNLFKDIGGAANR